MKPVSLTGAILVVDDEAVQRDIIADVLQDAGFHVELAAGVDAARERLGQDEWDLVLTDWRMPEGGGKAVLEEVGQVCPDTPVVVMTAYGSIEGAVEAIKLGACDYLSKPFDKSALLLVVNKGLARRKLTAENRRLREVVAHTTIDDLITGHSERMQKLKTLVVKAASAPTSVLLTGESGVGKEVVARAIHQLGPGPDAPFIAVNCAALPATLIESELFGHEKGAFTGAERRVRGRFEQAHGGTLLLDEISSMPLDLQSKLLRALQERVITRVGGHEIIPIETRIIAATNRDLGEAVRAGDFREDLYFRLHVLPITIPPLRERREDIPLFCVMFLGELAKRLGGAPRRLTPDALEVMQRFSWPGNVRQLQNTIERLVIITEGPDITAADVRGVLDTDQPSLPVRRSPQTDSEIHPQENGAAVDFLQQTGLTMDELEARLITEALERSNGQIRGAAKLLGLSYKTMQYRIRKYGVRTRDSGAAR